MNASHAGMSYNDLQIHGEALDAVQSALKAMYWVLFGPRSAWFPLGEPPPIPGDYEVRLDGDWKNETYLRSYSAGWNDPRVREWRGLAEKPL